MFRIASFQLPAHFGIGAFPETPEVLRDLHRFATGRQQVQGQSHAAVRDARRVGQAEQLLQLDREHRRRIGRIGDASLHAARHRDRGRRLLVEHAAQREAEPPRERIGQFGRLQPVEAALAGPEDGGRYREALESTIEESDRLIQTFNALLMIARIEAGSPDGAMSEVEASEIVRDVVELYEPVAEEQGAGITLDLPAPVTLKASRELLGQAVANLLDNALKYARPEGTGGPPTRISVALRQEGNDLVLVVADNGEGIPEKDRDRALQRFVRLERSRSRPGSGLGLSLVAAVAHLHHGTIELSDANPGLVVTLRLPIVKA